MIKVRQIKVEVISDNDDCRKKTLLKKMKLKDNHLLDYKITKQSLDARNKNEIYYVYEMVVNIINEKEYLIKNQNKDITYYE